MHNVLRDSLNFNSEDAVAIPDVEFKPVDLAQMYKQKTLNNEVENEASAEKVIVEGFDMTGYNPEQRKQVSEFLNFKLEEMRKKIQNETDFARAKLDEEIRLKREKIEADGETHRNEIIKHAQMQASEIFEKARQQGIKAGKQEKTEEITQKLQMLEDVLAEIKEAQHNRFEEFSEEIKWLSCDVACALVYKKIEEDDLYLKELVKAAIKEAKGADWISITLSDKLKDLVIELKKDYENSDVKTEFDTVSNVDVGDVVVNGSDRKIVASVREQISNIREYFRSFEEFEDSHEEKM